MFCMYSSLFSTRHNLKTITKMSTRSLLLYDEILRNARKIMYSWPNGKSGIFKFPHYYSPKKKRKDKGVQSVFINPLLTRKVYNICRIFFLMKLLVGFNNFE